MTSEPPGTGPPPRSRIPVAPQLVFFRTIAAVALAVAACLIPEVGPNRFWLAAILLFGCVPLAIWLEFHYPVAENGWSEPLFDLTVVVTLVHLVPQMWYVALVIGLMIVQAPSLGASRVSFLFHSLFAIILTAGMTLAAILHAVPDWQLPILAMTVLYPSIIFYSYWQARGANELRDRAQTLQSLHLLAGGVAHDFNNILAGVMGHAELALLELPADHPARDPVEEVVNGADRASLLSGRLLAFSGRDAGSDQILDLAEEARDLAALMKPVIRQGIELRVETDRGPHRAAGDRAELQQVLMNVILNAAEATDRTPNAVTIGLAASVDPATLRRWVTITVSDRGVGIPLAQQGRVFDPFFTSKQRGHGLGLAGARRIMARFGGDIGIRSAEGAGTRVELRLPQAERPEHGPDPLAAWPPDPGGLALVVDDEAPVRAVIDRLLAQLDYRAVLAEDGNRAVLLLRERAHEIAVVFLDLKMPGIDGWECLRRLREIRPDIPVVICSGFDPAASGDDVPPHVTFLPKPFRLDGLRDALGRVTATPS